MIPGPDLVLACPHCGAVSRLFSIAEGSPFGAVSWTDGYQEAPDSPAQPNLARCHSCKKLHWTREAAELGMIEAPASLEKRDVKFADFSLTELPPDGTPAPEAWLAAPQIAPVGEADYFEALRENMGSAPDLELELRVFAWWRGNDRYRKQETPGRYPSTPEAIENLERVIELTRNGDHEIALFHAEALRQMGRFEEALHALGSLCSDYAAARQKLTELIRENSRDLDVMFA